MLSLKKNRSLKNPEFSKAVLKFFNENKHKEKFWIHIYDYLLQQTNIENIELSVEDLNSVLDSLTDFNPANIEVINENDYQNLLGVLAKFEYKLKAMKMEKSPNPALPISSYEYIGNNKTQFGKSTELSSLLYKF